MLARGIRSYHRPTTVEEALSLAAQGLVPLSGGTRLFASPAEVPNVLDLAALRLTRLQVEDGDLLFGASTTLQDVIDAPVAYEATAGLLPAACRAQSASRMVRGLATLGGEAVHAAHDSEVVAALLALNAVFVVDRRDGRLESPALRFVKSSKEDLAGGGLVTSLFIPGAPQGAALERVAVAPSAPAQVAAVVAVSFSGDRCSRARLVVTGLDGPPARILEAEGRVEGTAARENDLEAAADEVAAAGAFRDDAHASAEYRRRVARVLTLRALNRAISQARAGARPRAPRCRPPLPPRNLPPVPYFTSGRIELAVNGVPRHAEVEARTTLLDLLRRLGLWGVKHGCETGECGACTVLLDGRPVPACMMLALRTQGRAVQTVEGLGGADDLHPVQQAFVETGAIQCGYCTPAMELCAKALIDAFPDPSEDEVRDALAGCLCRCTGYVKPVEAVLRAAGRLAGR
ncbi:MAG TPA: 2Fe-2S iron-sulfur cluster-binding protein [Vicinamibacteria bacterium]|jgi:aerobic-type carbon monoxide dehydrogenase small subunit (CoxS/CutS family)/CO/xanthine dehydrogenase FAD-binding subunit